MLLVDDLVFFDTLDLDAAARLLVGPQRCRRSVFARRMISEERKRMQPYLGVFVF
jgi:hypothetical protein